MAADRLQTMRRLVLATATGFILLVITLFAGASWRDYVATRQADQQIARDQALILGAQLDTSVRSTDAVLRLLADPDSDTLNRADRDGLARLIRDRRDVRALIVTDADGRLLIDSTVDLPQSLSLQDRPYFQTHQAGEARLHIDGPFVGRTSGSSFFTLSRPINDAGGNFAGIVVAIMEPAYFSELYQRISQSYGGVVRLMLADGRKLLCVPEPVSPDVVATAIIGDAHLTGPDLRLSVMIPEQRVWALWRLDLEANLAVSVLVVAGILLLTVGLLRKIDQVGLAQQALAEREQELRVSSLNLSAALDHMGQGLAMYGADGSLLLYNQRYAELFGLAIDQLRPGLGRNALRHALAQIDADNAPDCALPIAGPQADKREFDVPLRNGRFLRAYQAPLVEGGVILTFTDITPLTRTAAALRQAKEDAEAASRAKTQFLANVSHELRTPLNGIIGYAEALGGGYFGVLPPRHQEYVDTIARSGRHLLSLINDLLDVARAESGHLILHPEPVDLSRAIDTARRVVQWRAEEHELVLRVDVPTDLPRIDADARMVQQMLLNLLQNAIKFTPVGGFVTVSAMRDTGGGVRLAVTDSGIGIAMEHQQAVLDPFFQVENAETRRHDGTGLGLPLAKSFIEAHGGWLELDSQPGQGTSVRLIFPADRVLES